MTEFGFIDRIKDLFATLCPTTGSKVSATTAPCCPSAAGESLVFTTDMLAEGVHFLRHRHLRTASWGANPSP